MSYNKLVIVIVAFACLSSNVLQTDATRILIKKIKGVANSVCDFIHSGSLSYPHILCPSISSTLKPDSSTPVHGNGKLLNNLRS